MSKKICSTCGDEMGLGARSGENVKNQYECWCGNVEVEYYSEEELTLRNKFSENQGSGFLVTDIQENILPKSGF